MSRTKMKAFAIMMASALALTLAACNNGQSASPGNSGEPSKGTATKDVTITFQNINPDPSTPSYKMIKQIVGQYEQDHPHVKIELDSLNTDQQKLKLKTQAAAKEVPDITIVNPAAQMKPFVDAGLLAPLNDVADKEGLKDTFQNGLLNYYSFDDKLYAFPDGNNIEVVFYNKELFKQAGIQKLPTTFDELITTVKTLKAKGITPIAIGEKDSWTGSLLFMNILLRTNEGPNFLNDVLTVRRRLTTRLLWKRWMHFRNWCRQEPFRMELHLLTTMQAVISLKQEKPRCISWVHGKRGQLMLLR